MSDLFGSTDFFIASRTKRKAMSLPMLRPLVLLWPALYLSSSTLVGCRSDEGEQTYSDSYSEASHSNDAPADYEFVFDTDAVARIDIVIDPVDFESMQRDVNVAVAQDLTPAWFQATILQGDFIWDHVGIRYQSRKSIEKSWQLNSKKFPFKLTFDKFEDDHPQTKNQRFYGFKKLSFSSGAFDDSLVREVLASEAFLSTGVVAARAAFKRVYVDSGEGPVYWGLYTILEDVDEEPLQERHYGEKDENLYQPAGKPGADWTEFVEEAFEKENNRSAADYSDVEAAIAALHNQSDDQEAWRFALEESFAVESFLRTLAVNTIMVNWDSYGCKARNYYLYAAPSDEGRLNWIPTDLDESFHGSVVGCGEDAPADTELDVFHDSIGDEMPLISFLLDDPVYRESYAKFLREALDGTFKESNFVSRVEELHQLIEDYVVGENGEDPRYSNLSSEAAFLESVEGLLSHMQARRQLVERALDTEGN